MKRGKWVLALCGTTALTVGIGVAAERFDSKTANAKARTGQPAIKAAPTPGRFTRRVETFPPGDAAGEAPHTKNYGELFREEEPAPLPPPTNSRLLPDHVGAKREAAAQRDAHAAPIIAPAVPVIHAAHKPGQTPHQKTIQPVNSPDANAAAPKQPATPEAQPQSAPSVEVAAASHSDGEPSPQCPNIVVEWVRSGEINVGQECHLDLVVKNTGVSAASQVAVDAYFPPSVRLTKADPKPAHVSDHLTWNFETISPGAEHRLRLAMVPVRRGELTTTAQIRFTGTAAAVFKVEEPLLQIAVKGPSEVMLGDPASQTVLVSNPGTGIVHDVKVQAKLPEGLEHLGAKDWSVSVGSLKPGETRSVRLALAAVKGGPQTISLAATSSSDAAHAAVAQINVIAPSLKVAMDGPGLRYKGRIARYEVAVTNDGTVPSNNIRVSQSVGEGFKFVSADGGGSYDADSRSVQWFVGRLEPGQTSKLHVDLLANALGEFVQQAEAVSESGVRAEAKVPTKIDGIAALTMEIHDLDDPVEVGVETAYEIRVRNEGSKPAANVQIICELPIGVELLNAKGPSAAEQDQQQVAFKGLPQLAPGQSVSYQVHVRGMREGNHRFRARVTSTSVEEPLLLEELTKFYGDGN